MSSGHRENSILGVKRKVKKGEGKRIGGERREK